MQDDEVTTDTTSPVTLEAFEHVEGPFFHGTRAELQIGDELVAGRVSNFQPDRLMRNIYFTTLLDTAAWGAELAAALGDGDQPGRVYTVEPTGPFEDDPNVTDAKLPGNPTRSYRSRHPLRVLGRVEAWPGHDADTLRGMLDALTRMREQGLDVIVD